VLQDLDVPDAKRILEVESLFEGKVDFEKEYGHGKFAVSDLLWCSSMMFSNIAQKIGSKRLFLFTCEDSPHQGDQAAQLAAKTKAKDLADLGIEVELFNMNKPKERFNIERFYAVSAPSSSNKPRALLPFFPGGGLQTDCVARRTSSPSIRTKSPMLTQTHQREWASFWSACAGRSSKSVPWSGYLFTSPRTPRWVYDCESHVVWISLFFLSHPPLPQL